MGKDKNKKIMRFIRFMLAVWAGAIIILKYLEDRNM